MTRKPVLGSAFDQDQTNDEGRIENYLSELRYYRPRGFSKLTHEGKTILAGLQIDDDSAMSNSSYWMLKVDLLLPDWARRVS